jgi:dimethylargininase
MANETAVIEKEILRAPYVRSSTAPLRDVVLVAPGASLDRLVPLQGESSPIVSRAKEQHAILVRTLHDHGVRMHPLEEQDDTGLATFVGDCAMVVEGGAILLRPHKIERRREVAAVKAKLEQLGVPIVGKIEAPGLVDGGDVVVVGGTAYVGVPRTRPRSNSLGRDQLSRILASCGLRTAELAMEATIPRLNDVFSGVADDLVVAATDFVDTALLQGKANVVAIPRGDEYGASLLALAPRTVIANLRFAMALPILRKAKLNVVAIDLWEFGKVGGGPPSLVLPLKRGA